MRSGRFALFIVGVIPLLPAAADQALDRRLSDIAPTLMSTARGKESTSLQRRAGQTRLTFDRLALPAEENMGLLGLHYLVVLTPGSYAGLGGYGALSGDRGGFFTGGLSAGLRRPLHGHWLGDVGLFVGAGGGGAAPQGGGLMLRPHLALFYDFGAYRLGLDWNRIRFPNGGIDSRQLALIWERPFHLLYLAADAAQTPWLEVKNPAFIKRYLAVKAQGYYPSAGARLTHGGRHAQRMELIGFELGQWRDGRWFYYLETAGAYSGGVDGFAEVLAGFGYRRPLFNPNTAWTARLAAGGAGGGAVDTGGGGLLKGALGLQYRLARAWAAGLDAGYVDAWDGSFKARTLGLQVAYTLEPASAGAYALPASADDQYTLDHWRVRLAHQRYFPVRDMRRKSGAIDDQPVDLLGIKADVLITPAVYLTGQASGAYDGDAGGYAVGLLGLGWQGPAFWNKARLHAELLAGAAGGGGLDVGGGALVQPMAGFSYRLNSAWEAQISFGRVRALQGELKAGVLDLTFSYRFATLGRRPRD